MRTSRTALFFLRQGTPRLQISRGHIPLRLSSRTVPRGAPPFFLHYSIQHSSVSKRCPACGSILDLRTISCGSCGTLSPLPENFNYLSLFGLPSGQPFTFNIDVGKLKGEYLKMMSKVHPDSVIDKSEVSTIFPQSKNTGTKAYCRKCIRDDNSRLLDPSETSLTSCLSITSPRSSCSDH
jgi:hypothetical protein